MEMGSKSIGARVLTVSATDLGHLEHETPRNLVTLLQSSFFKAEFEEVARILSSREESTRQELARLEEWKVRFESKCSTLESETEFLKARNLELQGQLKGGVRVSGSRIADLERSLCEERDKVSVLDRKHGELVMALKEESEKVADLERRHGDLEGALNEEREKVSDLEIKQGVMDSAKFVAEEEAKRFRRSNERAHDQLQRLREDLELSISREKLAQQKIESLMEELERKGRETREKFIALKVEIRDLECGKKRAENGLDEWKRKYVKLEANRLHLISENLGITNRFISIEDEKTRMHVDQKPELVEISDSDDENDNGARGFVGHFKWGSRRSPHIKSEILCEEIQEERQFPQRKRNGSEVRDYRSVSQEGFVSSSTSTMRNATRVLTRCNMNDTEDQDDKIPIGKLKMRRPCEDTGGDRTK